MGQTDLPPVNLAFEWDWQKNVANLAKHGIDFDDAISIFEGPIVQLRSDQHEEERWLAVGLIEERVIAVVYTRSSGAYRIISARPARRNERESYRKALSEQPSAGEH